MSKSSNNSQQLCATKTAADIEIIDDENHSLVQINHLSGEWNDFTQAGADAELELKSISQLNHWFSCLPAAATAAAGNSSQLMTCSFEFSQLVQAKDGSGALGSVLKPGSNQIGAQARFQEAENLKSMVNANLVFNLASQILAQKHLADINERLQAIEQKVDAIQTHLENSRFAEIQTLHEHLCIIGKMLRSGAEITKDTLQNLAKSAQEVRKQVIHINKDISAAHKKTEQFDSTSWFGSNDIRDRLKQEISNIERLQREYLIGIQCLLMANLVLYIKHGGNKEFILASELFTKELNDTNGIIPNWERIKRKVAHHLNKMKPIFERAVSSQANALQVKRRLEQVDSLISIDTVQIIELNDRIQAAQSPQIMLEIVDGKVQRGRHLR